MKVLLTALNSKYVHSNLAIRYLKAYSKKENIQICEYTINDSITNIICDIHSKNVDVIAFSCYIWNIEQTLKIVHSLKKANKNIKIILGGPEVSYDARELLNHNPEVDFIIMGEGELTFKELIETIETKNDFSQILGIAYRNDKNIIINNPRALIHNLDDIPFPYDDLESFENKMIYYESSRGCPYNCQYCLSSTIEGVRFFSMDRVKADLNRFIETGVSQVKFIDRSFNCNKKRTKEMFRFLIEQNPNINFHCEINADIIDDEILDILKNARKDLFQFEIGVQTTNPKSVSAIKRESDFKKLSYVVNTINSYNNIHLHLDLIAGLPYEGYCEFEKSFNDVYNLRPQMLQLGFLKLLKGSNLRKMADKYNIKYNEYAPYEVISTDAISFEEIIRLKYIEDVLEKYHNSNRFCKTLEYIINNLNYTPFKFYEKLSEYWSDKGLFDLSHSSKSLYSILMDYINLYHNEYIDIINELLKFDYLCNHNNYILPDKINRQEVDLREKIFEFLNQDENINKYLSNYSEFSPKQIIKKIHVEVFDYNILNSNTYNKTILLFDYDTKDKAFSGANIIDISEKFEI